MPKILFISLAMLLLITGAADLHAQEWKFAKEKNGIKVYTREEPNSAMRSFKGEVDLHTTMEKLTNVVGNVKNTAWWDKNISEIKVISYEKGVNAKYYVVYDVPWPLSDRDLCVEAKYSTDPVTGERTIMSLPLLNVIPEHKDRIRIKKYWQRWTMRQVSPGVIHIVLEGSVDPGGIVPAWLYNMVITETPLRVIGGIQERVDNK